MAAAFLQIHTFRQPSIFVILFINNQASNEYLSIITDFIWVISERNLDMKAILKATTLIVLHIFPIFSSRFILVELETSKPTLSKGRSTTLERKIKEEGKVF